jgi:integrase
MSLYKPAKSKFWHYDFRFKGHRYHSSTGCTSKRDASRVEAEARRKAALGDEAKPSLNVLQACDAWFDVRGQHLRSAYDCRYQLVNLAEGLGPNTHLQDVTLTAIDKYIARRRATVSNASVNRETALLRRVVNWCADRGYDVPVIAWKQAKLKEGAVKTRVLSQAEEKRLFAALPASLEPIVRFALLSGQRRTEVIRLRWSDVDFPNARAWVWAKGGQRHSFPLTPELVAIIANQPKVCPQVFTYEAERSAPSRPDRPARIHGHRYPFSPQGWERKFKKALAVAGIEDFRFHDLRHTALTRLGSIEAAYELAGHSDIRTTKRYVHTAEDDVRARMAAAESRNSPEPRPSDLTQPIKKAANDG